MLHRDSGGEGGAPEDQQRSPLRGIELPRDAGVRRFSPESLLGGVDGLPVGAAEELIERAGEVLPLQPREDLSRIPADLHRDPAFAPECEIHLTGGDLAEPLAPLTGILAVQVLAERLSRHLGHDPDSPEGLNKITLSDH